MRDTHERSLRSAIAYVNLLSKCQCILIWSLSGVSLLTVIKLGEIYGDRTGINLSLRCV